MPVVRTLPWIAAATAAATLLAATAKYGPGISLDSVVYMRVAESVLERGALEVPLTRWDVESQRIALTHFPPLLPLALAATGAILGVDVVSAGRWLNAACAATTVLVTLLPLGRSVCAMLLVTALFTGASFLPLHLWLWSEPLFLVFVVASVRIATRGLGHETSARTMAWLGVCCGLATLTRYAGLALVAGYVVVIATWPAPRAWKARATAWLCAAYALTVAPWAWHLVGASSPPREIGFYTGRFVTDVVLPTAWTSASWFVLRSLPRPTAAVMLSVLLVVAALGARRLVTTAAGVARIACVPLVVLAVYVLFLVAARVLAEPGLPFDERILSPALVLLALALGELIRQLYPHGIALVPAAIVAWVGVVNVTATAPELAHSVVRGRGYAREGMLHSETISCLRDIAPGVTIFSNAADYVVAKLPVTAKYTPTHHDASRLAEFRQQVERAQPSIVVLFDDPHEDWLVSRDDLLRALEGLETQTFADAVVVSLGATGLSR